MIRDLLGRQFNFQPDGYQPDPDGRVLTVFSVSTSGAVTYRIDMPDSGPVLTSAPLRDVIAMIEQGFWSPLPPEG